MRIFDMQNPFWRFLGKLFDVVILNLLWTFCSLPLITIGGTTSAAYSICVGLIREDISGVAKNFFRNFHRDWKQTVPIGLFLLVMGGLLSFDLWYFLLIQHWLDGWLRLAVCVFLTVALILTASTAVYAFVLGSLFDNTVKGTLWNALLMALRHPIRSLSMLAISLLLIMAGALSLLYIPVLSIVFLMFGPVLSIFLHCLILFPVLSLYLPKDIDSGVQDQNQVGEDKHHLE